MGRRTTSQQRFVRPRPRQPRPQRRTARNPSFGASTIYSATVTNSGTLDARPVISMAGLSGPATVYFENADVGRTVWVSVPSGSGTLSVDFSTRTVSFAGAALSGAVTSESRWWALEPGANTVRSNIAASVTHRDAFSG